MMGWRSLPRIDWREHWQNPPNTDLQLTKKYMVHHGPLIHWAISISPDGLVSKQAEQDRLHQREVQPGYGSTPWTPLVIQLRGFLTLTICLFLDVFGFLVIYANHIHSSPKNGGCVGLGKAETQPNQIDELWNPKMALLCRLFTT